MGGFFGNAHYRNGFDFLEVHRAVATQAVVLRCHLSSSIGEAPRRICENRPEALAVHCCRKLLYRRETHSAAIPALSNMSTSPASPSYFAARHAWALLPLSTVALARGRAQVG